jgi:hypothetical protein
LISGVINRCRVDDSHFSAALLQQKVVDAVLLSRNHPFQILVRRQLAIARANEKIILQQQPIAEAPIQMERSTFERLVAPRPTVTVEPQRSRKMSRHEVSTHEREDGCPLVEDALAEGSSEDPVAPMDQSWAPRGRRHPKNGEQKRPHWR